MSADEEGLKVKIAKLSFTNTTEVKAGHGNIPFPVQILVNNEKPQFPEECIGLKHAETPDIIANYMSATGVWNTVQNEPELLNKRLSISAHLIQNPKYFFEKPSEAILTPAFETASANKSESDLIKEKRWRFRSSGEKHGILNDLKLYLEEIPGARGITGTIVSITDELFTNALFNAPFGDLNSTLDRTTLVVLDPDMSGQIIVGHTKDRLFVGCLDVFGSLDCNHLLERIYKGFNAGFSNSMNMNKGGAGIGILRMIDLASDIYVIVEKEKKTLVGCSFLLNQSSKKTRMSSKNFHFQNYQIIESPTGSIRVERRGSRALFRMSGDIKKDFLFDQLDLDGVKEVSLDLRLLKQSDPQILRIPLEIFKNTPTIEKVYFEYVPHEILVDASAMIAQSNALGEIGSVFLPFHCSNCKIASSIFFVKSKGPEVESERPTCSKCGGNLEPDGKIKEYIQK
jgi:hypothetical protein